MNQPIKTGMSAKGFKKKPVARHWVPPGDKDYQPNPEHYLGSRWTFTLADLEQAQRTEVDVVKLSCFSGSFSWL